MIPTQAAAALIASFRQPPAAHAVWVQTRINRSTGEAQSVLMVATNPKFVGRFSVPKEFFGYEVCEHAWPDDPREVMGEAVKQFIQPDPSTGMRFTAYRLEGEGEWPIIETGYIYHKVDLSDLAEPFLSAVKRSLEKDATPKERAI